MKSSNMVSKDPWLTVGKIVSPQGLAGELKVRPISDFPERFTKAGTRWLQRQDEAPSEIKLIAGRKVPGKSIYVIRFEGIKSRSTAETFVGKKVLVPSNQRPKLADNEFHFLDLVDLEVKLNKDGPSIGKVINLMNEGSDLLEIKLLEGKKVLIPFVKAIVPEVNLDQGWLIITPPPGLLNL